MTIQNNPITSHPLADQATWWTTDKTIKETEEFRNHKSPYIETHPSHAPNRIIEGGKDIFPPHGALTKASTRTYEGVPRV